MLAIRRAHPDVDTRFPEFIAAHDHVFVVEQNRDAQLRMMLVNECGIPPDKLGVVFQKFTRLESAPARKGTGLGLFITRHIVEAHGGRIEVESRPGAWVEFRFTLPCFRENKKGT